jgi:hypothetical protein
LSRVSEVNRILQAFARQNQTHSYQDESEEICIIPAPYAVIYPLTVMVASINTIIALRRRLVPT